MKAAIVTTYGAPDVIEIREIEKPSPKANEVLVKINATTITAGDARIRASRFPAGFTIPARLALGIFAPRFKVLGTEFSGIVEAVGTGVTKFKGGDEVIGFKLFNVHAEYTCINENKAILKKPNELSFEEAAALPFGGTTALYFLRKAQTKAGDKVLINGASGSVGVMAVQIAKAFGAHVTAVCSTANVELVKSLGADEVIDYKNEDPFASSVKYDMIMDTVGKLKFSEISKYLNTNGKFLAVVAGLPETIIGGLTRKDNGKKFIAGTASEKKEDLEFLINLVNEGKLKSVIGKVFDFDNIKEAHAYVDSGHKVGAAVLRL